jgi:hypothetical protein
MPRIVNDAWWKGSPEFKDILDVHYVAKAPIEYKAAALAVSLDTYWRRLRDARAYLNGFIAATN